MSNLPPLPTCRRHAFTLVELLVVIGIIALLISILLPTLGRARETANRAACLSNLRQLATAVLVYEQQFKSLPGRALPAYIDPDVASDPALGLSVAEKSAQLALNAAFAKCLGIGGVTGDVSLQTTTTGSSKNVWYCPSSRALRETATPYGGFTTRPLGYGYRINNQKSTRAGCFFGSHDTTASTSDEQRRPKKLAEVRGAFDPSDTTLTVIEKSKTRLTTSEIWMFSDLDGRNFSGGTAGNGKSPSSGKFGISNCQLEFNDRPWQPPHKSGKIGRCYSFFDGHADWRRTDDLPSNG